MADQVERLVTVWDARFDRLEDKLNKAVRATYGAAGKIEKRLDKANDNFRTKLGRGVGDTLNAELQGIASRAGPAGDALGAVGKAGLFAGAALGAMAIAANRAMEAMAFGDQLQATADKIQISAEALQELQFAAEETDVEIADLEGGLKSLNASIGLIKTGLAGGKLTKAFASIGIDKESLKDVEDANDLLPILADRLGQVRDTSQQVAIAKRLGIEELLPILRQGSDGLAEMRDRARELGLVISNDTVKALADADRQMELATRQIQSSLRVAFSGVAVDIAKATSALAEFLNWLRQSTDGMAVFLRNFQKLSQNIVPGAGLVDLARKELGRRQGGKALTADIREALSKPLERSAPADAGFSPIVGSGGGGGGKGSAKRDTTLQRQSEVDGELRSIERDLVSAMLSLATGAEERAELQLRQLGLEREAFDAELARKIADVKADEGLSAAKKTELVTQLETTRLEQDKVDALKRQAIDREAAAAKVRQALDLQVQSLDGETQLLLLKQGLARTSREQQAIAERLVELAFQREKAELEALIASQGVADADKELARLKLQQLEAQQPGRLEEARRAGSDAAGEATGVIDEFKKQGSAAEEHAAVLAEIERQRQGDLENTEIYEQAKAEIAHRYNEQRLQNSRQFFGDLATLSSSSNKTLAGIGKAAAIAQATIDGILAVQKALASAPPPFNFVLAAAAGAAAAVNVGKIAAMADGGPIHGPGGPREDKVPIYASNGEYLVNARATRNNRALLEAINSGQVPRFADGGLIGGRMTALQPRPLDAPRPGRASGSTHFHLEGAVVTQELMDQMNAISQKNSRGAYESARRDSALDAENLRYARDLNS